MDKKSLEEKKTSLEQQFNALKESNEKLNEQITNNNQELLKLSGEYRLVEEMEAKLEEKGKKNG